MAKTKKSEAARKAAKKAALPAMPAMEDMGPDPSPRSIRYGFRTHAKATEDTMAQYKLTQEKARAERSARVRVVGSPEWAAVQRCRFHPNSQGQPNTLSRTISAASSATDATATEISTLTEPPPPEKAAKKKKKRTPQRRALHFDSLACRMVENDKRLDELRCLQDQTAIKLARFSVELQALKTATLVPCANVEHPGHPDHPRQQTPIKQEPLDSV